MEYEKNSNRRSGSDRARLLEDFEERLKEADTQRVLRRVRSVAIVIHPTADEKELLETIDWEPSRCESVDAYWRYGDSVYWIEIMGCYTTDRPSGIYYLFDSRYRQDNFKVVLKGPLVYWRDLEYVFEQIEPLVDEGAVDKARSSFEGVAIRLADLQPCG